MYFIWWRRWKRFLEICYLWWNKFVLLVCFASHLACIIYSTDTRYTTAMCAIWLRKCAISSSWVLYLFVCGGMAPAFSGAFVPHAIVYIHKRLLSSRFFSGSQNINKIFSTFANSMAVLLFCLLFLSFHLSTLFLNTIYLQRFGCLAMQSLKMLIQEREREKMKQKNSGKMVHNLKLWKPNCCVREMERKPKQPSFREILPNQHYLNNCLFSALKRILPALKRRKKTIQTFFAVCAENETGRMHNLMRVAQWLKDMLTQRLHSKPLKFHDIHFVRFNSTVLSNVQEKMIQFHFSISKMIWIFFLLFVVVFPSKIENKNGFWIRKYLWFMMKCNVND